MTRILKSRSGTTNGTAGATRAYASLQEAMSALTAIGTLADAYTVYCEGSAADTLTVNQVHMGFTTSAANYVLITTTAGNRHDGKYNTSKYRIEVTDSHAIYNNYGSHIRIDGLQVKLTITTSVGQNFNCYRLSTANNNGAIDHRISNCIAQMIMAGSDHAFGYINSDPNGQGGTCKLWNCTAYGGYSGYEGDDGSSWADSNLINYNCTAYGNKYNFGEKQVCINCLSANPLFGDGFGFFDKGYANDFNNAADESSAAGTAPRINQTFTFVNAGASDFHLDQADTGAKGFGLTDPASGLFADDIDGKTRGSVWDIGADQVTTSSTPNALFYVKG